MTNGPRIRPTEQIETISQPGTPVRVGWYGRTGPTTAGFAKKVVREHHRIKVLDAYAISSDVLTALQAKQPRPTVVLIAERDTGNVLEFSADRFFRPEAYSEAGAVPEAILHDKYDGQTYVEIDAATVWPDHVNDVYATSIPEKDWGRDPSEITDGQSGLSRF